MRDGSAAYTPTPQTENIVKVFPRPTLSDSAAQPTRPNRLPVDMAIR